MQKRRTKEIILVGTFVIILGTELLREATINFLYFLKGDLGEIISSQTIGESIEILFLIFLIISGISFLLLKKWAFYFIRTCLLILFIIGIMTTLSALFIGFAGLPSFSFYLIMFAEIIALYLINRPHVKDRFTNQQQ